MRKMYNILKIRDYVVGGGFMFAMCSATDSFDIALAAEGIDICDTAREIIVEMVFQLGIGGVSKFKKMFEALRNKDYNEAANQMLDSQWRVQTPKRCQELSDLMRTCA